MTWSETLGALEIRAGELTFDVGSCRDPEETLPELNLCYKLDDRYGRMIMHVRQRSKRLPGFGLAATLKSLAV
jgi:hypothetical protein